MKFPEVKIWLDDTRKAPEGWIWLKSVNDAKAYIVAFKSMAEALKEKCQFYIDLDHDLGDYYELGGDAIKLLDWLEETGCGAYCVYKIHTMNPVGRENMMRIIKRNNWKLEQ